MRVTPASLSARTGTVAVPVLPSLVAVIVVAVTMSVPNTTRLRPAELDLERIALGEDEVGDRRLPAGRDDDVRHVAAVLFTTRNTPTEALRAAVHAHRSVDRRDR